MIQLRHIICTSVESLTNLDTNIARMNDSLPFLRVKYVHYKKYIKVGIKNIMFHCTQDVYNLMM